MKKILKLSFITLILLFTISLQYNSDNQNKSNEKSLRSLNLSIDNSTIDLSRLPPIIYNSWYNPKVEMLVVTPSTSPYNEQFINAVTPLVKWKNHKGLKTIILSNFSEYSGRDNAEKIRNMIKSYYENENIKWVLLLGDAEENLIPIRYVYNPDVVEVGGGESEYSNWDDYYKPTDFYYADLTDTWDNDNDNKFGESVKYNSDETDEISWIPEVYVGRFPADTALELEIMVNKSLNYEMNPFIGNWMNRMLLAGGISEYFPDEDEARLTEYIWKNYTRFEMNFTHLHKTTSSFNPTTPPPPNNESVLNSNNFDINFDLGYSTVFFAGHGDPTQFYSLNLGTVYDNSDANSCNNSQMPSLIYADACTTSSYDKNDNSIGEILIKRPNAGAVGYIGGLRVTWYINNDTDLEYLNRGNAKLFWKFFFNQSYYQQGKALYESKIAYMNSDIFLHGSSMDYEWHRKNILTYCLLGDPELDIYTKKPVKALYPFDDFIYSEAQYISSLIKDKNNRSIPYARVNLKTNDGKYKTVYADEEGVVHFRLPPQANEVYNITITGHNLIPSYFNFSTISDDTKPQIIDSNWSPKFPSIMDHMHFNITAFDNQSGIESIFILLSNNNFNDYTYYRINNTNLQEQITFNYEINKLDPGDYSFAYFIRDYANNSNILYNESFIFSIPKPIIDYVIIITLFMIIGLTGISFFVVLNGLKKSRKASK